MTTDAGSGFDNQAAGRDAGDELLEEESRHLTGEEPNNDDVVDEEDRERKQSQDSVNDAF